MIPTTTHTDLHHITGILTLLAVERRQLRRLGDAPTVRGQTTTEDIRNVDQFLLFTNRAINLSKFTDIFRGPQQFGVSVTNIDASQPSSLYFGEEVAAGQLVIDRGRPSPIGSTYGIRAKRHYRIRYRSGIAGKDDSAWFPWFCAGNSDGMPSTSPLCSVVRPNHCRYEVDGDQRTTFPSNVFTNVLLVSTLNNSTPTTQTAADREGRAADS